MTVVYIKPAVLSRDTHLSFLAIIMVLTACQPATSIAIPTATVEVLPSTTLTSTPEPTVTATEAPPAAPEIQNFSINSAPESFRDNPLGTVDFTKPDSVTKFSKDMDDYFQFAKELAQKTQFDPSVQPVVLKEHFAPAFGGNVLYPDNTDAVQAIDFKELFVTGPDGVNYPERIYTFALKTADGNIPVILVRSYYQPAWPSNDRDNLDKINQGIDTYSIPYFKEWGKVLPILASEIPPGGAQDVDPVVAWTLKNYPDIADRINKAATTDTQVGDPGVLSQSGLFFLTFEPNPKSSAPFW